jgi:hypothetical protein
MGLLLAIGMGRLLGLTGGGLRRIAASYGLGILKRLVNHGATRCLASVWNSLQDFCLRGAMLLSFS